MSVMRRRKTDSSKESSGPASKGQPEDNNESLQERDVERSSSGASPDFSDMVSNSSVQIEHISADLEREAHSRFTDQRQDDFDSSKNPENWEQKQQVVEADKTAKYTVEKSGCCSSDCCARYSIVLTTLLVIIWLLAFYLPLVILLVISTLAYLFL